MYSPLRFINEKSIYFAFQKTTGTSSTAIWPTPPPSSSCCSISLWRFSHQHDERKKRSWYHNLNLQNIEINPTQINKKKPGLGFLKPRCRVQNRVLVNHSLMMRERGLGKSSLSSSSAPSSKTSWRWEGWRISPWFSCCFWCHPGWFKRLTPMRIVRNSVSACGNPAKRRPNASTGKALDSRLAIVSSSCYNCSSGIRKLFHRA